MLTAVIIIGAVIAVPVILASAFHVALCISIRKWKEEMDMQSN